MDLQNVVNFIQRPRMVSQHPQDVALRLAARRPVRGTSGLADSVAADIYGSSTPSQPASGGGMTTGEGIQLATTIASSLAQIGTSIYSSQLQKEQAARDAKLQQQMLDVQKNQQSLEAYRLLASAQGRAVANGAGTVSAGGGGDSGSGAMMIAAGVGLLALMMLR